VASEQHPLAAVELAEVLATADVPGGVVNILTGNRDELGPVLASHMDVNALDVSGGDGQVPELEELAAENVKRVVHGARDDQSPSRSATRSRCRSSSGGTESTPTGWPAPTLASSISPPGRAGSAGATTSSSAPTSSSTTTSSWRCGSRTTSSSWTRWRSSTPS